MLNKTNQTQTVNHLEIAVTKSAMLSKQTRLKIATDIRDANRHLPTDKQKPHEDIAHLTHVVRSANGRALKALKRNGMHKVFSKPDKIENNA